MVNSSAFVLVQFKVAALEQPMKTTIFQKLEKCGAP
jgi:hypothetical protein